MPQPDLTERLLRLRGVPMFRSMTTSELAPLAETLRAATFDKGDVLLHEDEPPRSFYMLVRGAVRMRRGGNTIRTVPAPGAVGFLSLLARTSGGTEAVAESRTDTFELRADAIHEMFEDHFSALLGTLRWVSERLMDETLVEEPRPYQPVSGALDGLVGEHELGMVARIFLLRRTTGFKHANVNSTARLARSLREIRLPAGSAVWRAGEPATHALFLVKGNMELSWARPNDGKPMVQIVGPGSIVGNVEAIAGRPRYGQLVTLEPAVFLQASREAVIDMLEDDFEVALQFLSVLAAQLLGSWDRKAEASAVSPPKIPGASEARDRG